MFYLFIRSAIFRLYEQREIPGWGKSKIRPIVEERERKNKNKD